MDTRREIDIAVSLMAMPALAFATAAAWVTSREPVFIHQKRIGLNGKRFTVTKFRSMEKGRITPIGKIARSIGADELPQFLSVLKGEMSLIGPRPILAKDDAVGKAVAGSEKWKRRNEIKPGLIAPSAIYEKLEGNGYTDPKIRLADDLAYIAKRKAGHAFKEDIHLIWSTVLIGLMRRGDPQATIPAPRMPTSSSAELNS